jgi:ATP-dependent DNA helicase RecG
MRPALLDPLFAPAASLPGVGPKVAKLLDRLLGRDERDARAIDVLFHIPHATLDRRARPKIRDAERDTIATIEVRVAEHQPPQNSRGKAPFRVIVEDDTGDVELVFFQNNHDWVRKMLPVGARRWISGRLEMWDGRLQMVHPDRVMDDAELARMPAVEPVYGLTDGLYPRVMAKAAQGALSRLPRLPEWRAATDAPTFGEALALMHSPQRPEDIDPLGAAAKRLGYDEMLANQIALAMVRARLKLSPGRASVGDGRITGKILKALPFALTGAQTRALSDINADLAAPTRMLRLLQGDVGSGKTVVALLAMASVVEAGRQAALMAPTEILARQHFERMAPLAEAAGLRLALITGRDRAAERKRALAALAEGAIDIAIGTHALFQDAIIFRDLALAVVDEQHRFGVHQRLRLAAKGDWVDLLVMTATPIPRTLALTFFGDMDISALDEKPPGRTPIDTRALPLDRLDEVVAGIGRAVAGGARVYWVCPLVAESAESDLAAASERAESLRAYFGEAVGLIHGAMKGADKDSAMERFASGETKILVATTVIEVGVDVAEASVMVIEHAERFGLAQLHQLRGRVGRGAARSTCLLLYRAPLGEVARARIEILRQTEDGFRIAEEDLRLRGEGEALGSRQSGLPGFRLARLDLHADMLPGARAEAMALLAADPELNSPRGRATRLLLWLFERDEAARLLEAG